MTSSGDAFRTQTLVEVQPGTVLTGVMRMLSLHATWSFWVCEFVGFPDTALSVNVTGQLVMPVQTLEAYTVQECRDYPATSMTSMRAIGVNTATAALATSFSAVDGVNDCGQHAIVVSNAAGSGQVTYYSRQFISLSPAAVTSVSRSRIRSTCSRWVPTAASTRRSGTPAGGWFGRWFRLADSRFGDQFTIPPGSPISVLSRFPEHLDLFAVGRDAAVYSTFWDANGGWPNNWFRLADTNFGDGFKVPLGSQVTSVARAPDLIDLFVAGFDGGVYSTFWNAPGGWFTLVPARRQPLLGQLYRPARHTDRGYFALPGHSTFRERTRRPCLQYLLTPAPAGPGVGSARRRQFRRYGSARLTGDRAVALSRPD